MYQGAQKRIYIENAQYFLTFNTQDRLKYFSESIFCEVFIVGLRLSKIFYKFNLYAFVVSEDHVHLLLLPRQVQDLSSIIKYIKRHITRNINYILGYSTEEAIGQSLLRLGDEYAGYKDEIGEINKLLGKLKIEFIFKYGEQQNVFPKFSWQKSFHDHYIRNEKDFKKHFDYICANPIKHKIPDATGYKYIFTNYPKLIDEN